MCGTSTDKAPAKFFLVAMLCTFNHALYFSALISWFGVFDTQTYALVALIHIILMGTANAFSARNDATVSTDRRRRMAEQGGHSLMLAHFAGFAPLAEFIQWNRGSPAGSGAKASTAVLLHAVGACVPQLALSYFAADALKSLKTALQTAPLAAANAAAALAEATAETVAEAASDVASAAAGVAASAEGGPTVTAFLSELSATTSARAAAAAMRGSPAVFGGSTDALRAATAGLMTTLLWWGAVATAAAGLVLVAGWGAEYIQQAQEEGERKAASAEATSKIGTVSGVASLTAAQRAAAPKGKLTSAVTAANAGNAAAVAVVKPKTVKAD